MGFSMWLRNVRTIGKARRCERAQRKWARRPLLEPLETRNLPTSLIFLDFNGYSQSDIDYIQQHQLATTVANTSTEASFLSGFSVLNSPSQHPADSYPFRQYGGYSTFSFLDFDGDGDLDAADGNIAAGQILERARLIFAAYDVQVIREDSAPAAVDRMINNSATGDALMFVTGNTHPEGTGGVAPLNPGNTDDVGAAGCSVCLARYLVDNNLSGAAAREAFINVNASIVGQEVGHTYGLGHINPNPNREVMPAVIDGFHLDTFQDITYPLDAGGFQNSYQILTSALGPSTGPWAAVLTPGILTIRGSTGADTVSIAPDAASPSDWLVSITSAAAVRPIASTPVPHRMPSPSTPSAPPSARSSF